MSQIRPHIAASITLRPGPISIRLSAVFGLLVMLVVGNALAAIEVGLAIENGIDGKGIITVVNGGKVKVAFSVIEDSNQELHKKDKIELVRVADDSLVSSVLRGKAESGTARIPVKNSENEALYVRYVRKGQAGEVVATAAHPDSADQVPLRSISSQKLADLAVRINAVETAQAPQLQNRLSVSSSGADFTSIQAALDSITTASASNPFVVKVWPGIYDEAVVMKAYVDIEGSGQSNTIIRSDAQATLTGADQTELRNIAIENNNSTLSSSQAILLSSSPSIWITDVTVRALGTGSVVSGIQTRGSSAPVIRNVTVITNGAASLAAGLQVNDISTPTLINVHATASGSPADVALWKFSNRTMTVIGGRFTGSRNSFLGVNGGLTRFVGTQLDNLVEPDGGILVCRNSYDAAYAALNAVCQ